MRIETEINEKGLFWLPSHPDNKIEGELTISDGGIVKVKLDDPLGLNNAIELMLFYIGNIDPSFFSPKIVFGETSNQKITLRNSFYLHDHYKTHRYLVNSNIPCVLFSHECILGEHINKNEIEISSVEFSIECIDLFFKKLRADYNKKIKFYFDDTDITIEVSSGEHIFKISSERSKNIVFFIKYIRIFCTFFNFFMRRTLSIKNINIEYNHSSLNYFYQSLPYVESNQLDKVHAETLAHSHEFICDFLQFIPNWFEMFEKYSYNIILITNSQQNLGRGNLDNTFLDISKALESFSAAIDPIHIFDNASYEKYCSDICKIISHVESNNLFPNIDDKKAFIENSLKFKYEKYLEFENDIDNLHNFIEKTNCLE